MRFEGVIFDMDGVLCDSEPFICAAAARMFKEVHGLAVTHDDFKPFTGTGEDRFLGGVAEVHGVTLTMPRDKQTTYRFYLEMIQGELQPLPGAVAFIASLRKAGIKLAVASSADRVKVDGNLHQIGLPPEHFDVVVCGDDVERKKPDPQIFLLAAERLGLDAAKCLVVEDAVSGCQAGQAAGAKVLGITTSFSCDDLKQAGADWCAADLAHVPTEVMG